METPQQQSEFIKKLEEIQQSCLTTKTLYNGMTYQEIKLDKINAYFTLEKVIKKVKQGIL